MLKGNGSGSVITVNSGGNLTLTDSSPNSNHQGYVDSAGLWHLGTGSGTGKSISGGIITGGTGTALTECGYNVGGGVFVDGGTFNLSGGTISGNGITGVNSMGGGVFVGGDLETGGTFNMSGGTITGNTVEPRRHHL